MKKEEKTDSKAAKKKVSEEYGDAFREFDWSYKVDALPKPISNTRRGVKPVAPSETAQAEMFRLVIKDIEAEQGNPITSVYGIETGVEGFRHLHALIGNISRLTPRQIVSCFRVNGFGDTKVELWSRKLESGYPFKVLDRLSFTYGSDSGHWDLDVTWNRRCKQQMKLNRRHLERLLEPKRQPKSAELRRLIAASEK